MKTEHMIPKVYMESGDMRALCRFFDLEFDLLKYQTDHILDCYSPEHCLEHLLPELAEHIGFDYQELKSVMYNRVVLKHFIRDLIRYRGSATGIANAAAIDIRYRLAYPTERYDMERHTWVPEEKAGEPIPMEFHEAIPVEKTWIDVDHPNGLIYLFVIVSDYFSSGHGGQSSYYQGAKTHEDRMRRLLDLAYLQEYVRPVGMYLLPMVAEKVNAKTDLTVKAVRIPENELWKENGVTGTPNASEQHRYDRIHFAQVETNYPPDERQVDGTPWIRTLYHSQVAGNLTHQYFTKPVYHVDGKFLYYDHEELTEIYQDIMQTKTGMMKVGDALYNPNSPYATPTCYAYTADRANEPYSLEMEYKEELIPLDENGHPTAPLLYPDNVGFDTKIRVYQRNLMNLSDQDRYQYDKDEVLMVIYVPEPVDEHGEPIENRYPVYLYADDAVMSPDHPYAHLIPDSFWNNPEHPDDGTNRNLIFNLFQLDEEGNSPYTGMYDISIMGKHGDPYLPVPYSTSIISPPDGTNMNIILHDELELTDENRDLYIP